MCFFFIFTPLHTHAHFHLLRRDAIARRTAARLVSPWREAAAGELEALKRTSRRAARETDALAAKVKKATQLAAAEEAQRRRLLQQRRDALHENRAMLDHEKGFEVRRRV